MAASVQTRYYHGSSPGVASSDVTGATVRHKLADNDTTDSNNPIPLPGAGMNLGWRKSSKVNFVTSPAGSITNLRWFVSGGPPTGIRFFARVQSTGTYVFATSNDQNGITGFTDTVPNQNANDVALVPYNSSTPLTVQGGTVLSNPATGEGGTNQVFVETQLGVLSTYAGGPGPITAFQATYRYSET